MFKVSGLLFRAYGLVPVVWFSITLIRIPPCGE